MHRFRALALAALAVFVLAGPASADTKPTIVLVHGAFADASGFGAEIGALERAGYTVLAPPNPLRGVTFDAASLDGFLATIPGPVVLVGHSYGGAVITRSAATNIKSLVYLAAFAPTTGESVLDLVTKNPGSLLGPPTLVARGEDQYIKPSAFRNVFAQDVPAGQAAVMAATQRPLTVAALTEKLNVAPAWASHPSFYLVAEHDHAIPPVTERFMAARMRARTVSVDSSHAVMVTQPKAVTALILRAAR